MDRDRTSEAGDYPKWPGGWGSFPEDTEGGRYRVVSVSQTGKVFGEAKDST